MEGTRLDPSVVRVARLVQVALVHALASMEEQCNLTLEPTPRLGVVDACRRRAQLTPQHSRHDLARARDEAAWQGPHVHPLVGRRWDGHHLQPRAFLRVPPSHDRGRPVVRTPPPEGAAVGQPRAALRVARTVRAIEVQRPFKGGALLPLLCGEVSRTHRVGPATLHAAAVRLEHAVERDAWRRVPVPPDAPRDLRVQDGGTCRVGRVCGACLRVRLEQSRGLAVGRDVRVVARNRLLLRCVRDMSHAALFTRQLVRSPRSLRLVVVGGDQSRVDAPLPLDSQPGPYGGRATPAVHFAHDAPRR